MNRHRLSLSVVTATLLLCSACAEMESGGGSTAVLGMTPETATTRTTTMVPQAGTEWPMIAAPTTQSARTSMPPARRILFVGDLMIGRRVGELAALDPESVFEDVEYVVSAADLAVANLESPLTQRNHESDSPFHLEADPAHAELIAAAGFDVVGIANNHAGDAGAASVLDTIEAVVSVGMVPVGGGGDMATAWSPRFFDLNGVDVALLAVDVSSQGLAAGDGAGIAVWDERRAHAAVTAAAASADVVAVGIHGGAPYWTGTDPVLDPVARQLVEWGADVVWGHGPHVAQPVVAVDRPGARTAVIATSLGNFLFDQQNEPQNTGLILETLVSRAGVVAWRLGSTRGDDLRVHFRDWFVPEGDAVMVDGEWWSTPIEHSGRAAVRDVRSFPYGDVVAAASGDVAGDGVDRFLVSYRHPEREVVADPRPREKDALGRTAHIGVFEADGTPVWMSHRPPHAVVDLTTCTGTAIFAYSAIDDDATIAIGAGEWNGFGYTLAPELAGPGTIGCVDIDGDRRLEPIVTDR